MRPNSTTEAAQLEEIKNILTMLRPTNEMDANMERLQRNILQPQSDKPFISEAEHQKQLNLFLLSTQAPKIGQLLVEHALTREQHPNAPISNPAILKLLPSEARNIQRVEDRLTLYVLSDPRDRCEGLAAWLIETWRLVYVKTAALSSNPKVLDQQHPLAVALKNCNTKGVSSSLTSDLTVVPPSTRQMKDVFDNKREAGVMGGWMSNSLFGMSARRTPEEATERLFTEANKGRRSGFSEAAAYTIEGLCIQRPRRL